MSRPFRWNGTRIRRNVVVKEPVRIGGNPGKGFEPVTNASQRRFCFGTQLGVCGKNAGLRWFVVET